MRGSTAISALVSATNRNLLQSIEQGHFRHDLYHRIGGWIFHVPPLRERREDILPLARHFLLTFLPGISEADFDLPVRNICSTVLTPATCGTCAN
jgi:transcriptional regulator with GAF, ATPase, and Fis domain